MSCYNNHNYNKTLLQIKNKSFLITQFYWWWWYVYIHWFGGFLINCLILFLPKQHSLRTLLKSTFVQKRARRQYTQNIQSSLFILQLVKFINWFFLINTIISKKLCFFYGSTVSVTLYGCRLCF